MLLTSELDRLGQLPDNWDGYGAEPIRPAILRAARDFLNRLPSEIGEPLVVPMSSGAIQFEWHAGPRILELEIEDPQTIHYLKWHPEQGIKEEDSIPIDDSSRAVALIAWFLGGLAECPTLTYAVPQ